VSLVSVEVVVLGAGERATRYSPLRSLYRSRLVRVMPHMVRSVAPPPSYYGGLAKESALVALFGGSSPSEIISLLVPPCSAPLMKAI